MDIEREFNRALTLEYGDANLEASIVRGGYLDMCSIEIHTIGY